MIYKKFNKFELLLAILTTIAIFLFYLLFNLNYLSTWIDEMGDCITYDYYVRLGLPEFLFNPHHIAFDWIGGVFYNILKDGGYTGKSMIVLQLRNLVASSLGLSLFFLFMYKISKKYLLSLLIAMCISFSAAYWIYSQINDTPIIHSVIVFVLCFVIFYFPYAKHKILFSIFIGILHSVNIFFHQYDALFFLVIFFVMLFANNFLPLESNSDFKFITHTKLKFQNFKYFDFSNFRYFLIYFVTFVIVVSSAYYYVGVVKLNLTLNKSEAKTFNKIKDANYFFNWLILYTKIDHWGKGLEKRDNLATNVATGVSTHFFQPKHFEKDLKLDFNRFTKTEIIIINFILIMFGLILIFLTILLPHLFKKYGFVILSAILFLIIYTIFSFWWEPYYREFYVATMSSYWLVLFLGFNFIIDKLKTFSKIVIYSYLFLFVFLLFFHNFTVLIYPNSGKEFRTFDIVKTELVKTK